MIVFWLPCTCEISSVSVELQLELNALQKDDIIVKSFSEINLIDFYKFLSVVEHDDLKQLAKKFICLFGSKYT